MQLAFARLCRSRVAITLAALAGAGCAGHVPREVRSGQSVDELLQRLGQPTARYTMPGGERLEYARGPFGRHTYMIDIDRQGKVIEWTQVLNEKNFDALPVGIMRDAVLQTLGTPSERQPIPRQRLEVWSYRYEAIFCQWFQVEVGFDGVVKQTGYGPDPLCMNPHE
jgi:hypothetical protein